MDLWTTFSPQKICWELTNIHTQEQAPSSDWRSHLWLIKQALLDLKQAGIRGIRLVIFPEDITPDGKQFDFTPVEVMLAACEKENLGVDWCLGPFQYAFYPGIHLPNALTKLLSQTEHFLDNTQAFYVYGKHFLTAQLDVFGNDKRIRGFYLGNEWPDVHGIAGNEQVHKAISHEFMYEAAKLCKLRTDKPIMLNTNIDAVHCGKCSLTFREIFTLLNAQGKLGFDIYPSQETWKKVPHIKLARICRSYKQSLRHIRSHFPKTQVYFAEVEAQPWGDGRSWYKIIKSAPNSQEEILHYKTTDLAKTFQKYITETGVAEASFWGADFWLAAKALGVNWPLEQISVICLLQVYTYSVKKYVNIKWLSDKIISTIAKY